MRKLVMLVSERVSHQWLLKRRVVAARTAHRLEVATRQLIHTQWIVDVAWVCSNRIAMNDWEFVVEERIESMVIVLLMVIVRLVHRLCFYLHIVGHLLLLLQLLFLDVFLRKNSVRLLVVLVLAIPSRTGFVSLQLIHERRHHLMIVVVV